MLQQNQFGLEYPFCGSQGAGISGFRVTLAALSWSLVGLGEVYTPATQAKLAIDSFTHYEVIPYPQILFSNLKSNYCVACPQMF